MPLSEETRNKIKDIASRYPSVGSAILPALHQAQKESGHLSEETIEEVALALGISPDYVYSTASFYTMFNLKPIGKYHIQVCRNLSCSLLGARRLVDHIGTRLGIKAGDTTKDGNFTLSQVECLGACGGAPVMMVNDKYYENLTEEKIDGILEDLKKKC